jgi:hypothetical protein
LERRAAIASRRIRRWTDRTNSYFLQVLLCKTRENPLANLVLAEHRLIPLEAKAPQPTSDIHGGAPARHLAMILVETVVLG